MEQSKVAPMQPTLDVVSGTITRKEKKAAYTQPALIVYGCVSNLTRSGQGTGTDGGAVTKNWKGSERRLKENIIRIGDHTLGMGLYLFDYKPEYRDLWGHGRQFGVMVDEVEVVTPEAISVHPDGYKLVDYAVLGISRNIH